MIKYRLKNIKTLKGQYKFLPQDQAVADINQLTYLLFAAPKAINKKLEENVSNASIAEISDWFKTLGISEEQVDVYWIASQEGIQITFQDFISNFDDLWYPGADDVLITTVEQDWILQLHHEEIFSLYVKFW